MVEPSALLRPHRGPRHQARCQQLHTGDRVGLFYPSANRDKKVFADPFRFELKVMIGALLRRFDVIEITGEPTWMSAGPAAAVGVAVQSLPVRLA